MKVLAYACGVTASQRRVLVDAVLERQARNVRFWSEAQELATPVQISERIAWSRREHAFTTTHREVFEAALEMG